MHISWKDIENFHNVRRSLQKFPELLGDHKTVTYRGKVKLHGTNSGIQIINDNVVAQSRTQTVISGHFGFPDWVSKNKEQFIKNCKSDYGMVLFGEFVGSGIQKGVAVSSLKEKVFALFAACMLDANEKVTDDLIIEPDELSKYIVDIPNAYIIPWHTETFELPWLDESDSLKPILDNINNAVIEVERCDPWVDNLFGIKGVGEGIVYYPISHLGRTNFGNLAFKAKGEKHSVVAKTKPAQADPTIVNSANAFAELVLPEARLEQGVCAVSGQLVFDTKNIGSFLKWIAEDINKETKAELEASGLDRKTALNAVTNYARKWFLDKSKSL